MHMAEGSSQLFTAVPTAAAGESLPIGLARAAGLNFPGNPGTQSSLPFCVAAVLEVVNGALRENADQGRIIVVPTGEHVAVRMLIVFSAAEAQTGTHTADFGHQEMEAAMQAAAETMSLWP